jgi:hypothetical protein
MKHEEGSDGSQQPGVPHATGGHQRHRNEQRQRRHEVRIARKPPPTGSNGLSSLIIGYDICRGLGSGWNFAPRSASL